MAGAGSPQEQGVLDLQRDPCLWGSNPSTASQAGAGAWSEGARMELLSLRVGGVPGAGSAEGAVITFRSGRGSAAALADFVTLLGQPGSHPLPIPQGSWLLPLQGHSRAEEEGEEVTAGAPPI